MKFIEVKDSRGNDALIDPFSIHAVRQMVENNEKITIIYFNNNVLELSESYEQVKHKLEECFKNF